VCHAAFVCYTVTDANLRSFVLTAIVLNTYTYTIQGMSLEQLAAGAACAADLADEIDAIAKHSAATTNNTSAEANSSVRVQVSDIIHLMYML
jgi:hypothetical protein